MLSPWNESNKLRRQVVEKECVHVTPPNFRCAKYNQKVRPQEHTKDEDLGFHEKQTNL